MFVRGPDARRCDGDGSHDGRRIRTRSAGTQRSAIRWVATRYPVRLNSRRCPIHMRSR